MADSAFTPQAPARHGSPPWASSTDPPSDTTNRERSPESPPFADAHTPEDGAGPSVGRPGVSNAAIAPAGDPRTSPWVTYATHIQGARRVARLRPAAPDERPVLPIAPAPHHERPHASSGPAPGSVVRFETRYWGTVPVTRRLDGSGRLLWDGLAKILGWGPGTALVARTGPGHWVTLRSAGRTAGPDDRRRAHVDDKGRLVVPKGLRVCLAAGGDTELVLRPDAADGSLRLAHASVLALALDVLERVETWADPDSPATPATPAPDAGDCAAGSPPHPRLPNHVQGGRS